MKALTKTLLLAVLVVLLLLPSGQCLAAEGNQFKNVLWVDVIKQVYISPNFSQDKTVYVIAEDKTPYLTTPYRSMTEAILYRSQDGGITWNSLEFSVLDNNMTRTQSNIDPIDLTFMPDGTLLMSGSFTDNGKFFLATSRDGGKSWETLGSDQYTGSNQYFDQNVGLYNIEPIGSKLLGVFSNGLSLSDDGGKTWSNIVLPKVLSINGSLAVLNESRYFVLTSEGILYIRDDSKGKWLDTSIRISGARIQRGKIAALSDGSTLVACDPNVVAGIYVSRDGGENWNKSSEQYLGKVNSVTATTDGLFFAGTPGGRVALSANYGSTWEMLEGKVSGEITDIQCVPFGDNIAVFVSTSDGLYRMEYHKPQAGQKEDVPPVQTSPAARFFIGKNNYYVNDSLKGMDAVPFVETNRTYVPVRFLADALGALVKWDEGTQTVSLMKGSTTIDLEVGSNYIVVNGKKVGMDVQTIVRNDRTYLPARYVAEAFGYGVKWDETNQTVIVDK